MAVNRKGGNPFVALLLAHGEKAGIALALLLAGWLAYGSLSFEAVDEEPNSLRQLADAANNRVEEFTWRDALDEEEGAKLSEGFRPIPSTMVDARFYDVGKTGFNPGVLPRTVFRPDPPLLPATSLQVSAGTELMGFEDQAFARNKRLDELKEEKRKERERQREREQDRDGRGLAGRDANGDEPIRVSGPRNGVSLDEEDKAEIVSYAIVMAKVPVKDQIDTFRRVLKDASGYDKNNDQPQYLGYYVERRDVSPSGPGEWGPVFLRNSYNSKKLDAVDPNTIAITTLDWVEDLEEVAATDYLDDAVTFPLPPLVGRDWGPEVVHSEVPLQAEAELEERERTRNDPLNRGGRGGRGGDQVGFARIDNLRPDDQGSGSRQIEDDIALVYPEPFLMLRFFDMTVRPGSQHQYRVRLVVRDPNASIDRAILAKDVIERMEKEDAELPEGVDLPSDLRFRLSEWSEASPVVSIPQSGGVLLSDITPRRREAFNAEPTVKLVVDAFATVENAIAPSSTEREFQRGGVANFRGVDVRVIQDRELKTVEEFQYRTDVTLLDIRGGEPLGRDSKTPASILVMDASGRMSVHTELIDAGKAREQIDRYSGKQDNFRGGARSRPSESGPPEYGPGGAF